MTRASLSAIEVLDDSADAVTRVAAPWVGVLWLTALPLRLLQAHFIARVTDLGPSAALYGDHLRQLALAALGALLLSLWGRAVFVRACGLGLRPEPLSSRHILRVPAAGLACYVYSALLLETLFFALGWTIVALPLLIALAGLAAAALPLYERPGLVAPLRVLATQLGTRGTLAALVLVFATALLVAFVNLYFLFQLGFWLAGAVPGLDPTPWTPLLRIGHLRFVLVLSAGALLAVEPFWLGACVVYVHKLRARHTGEDLRLWFERLRSEAP